MSNPCARYVPGEIHGCPCDRFIHPKTLSIEAGLTAIPRQIADFHEFRDAMLRALRDLDKPALNSWRARDEDDLGIMFLEMWAYVCDSLSFYDEVIAHETFLRTARQKNSVRKLVSLLGYLPRPAVGSTAYLAAIADGRLPLELPRGTSFRSGGFGSEPPQVFELDKKTMIHPFNNRWDIAPPKTETIREHHPGFLLVLPQAEIKAGSILFIRHLHIHEHNEAVLVKAEESCKLPDNSTCRKVTFTSPTRLQKNTNLSGIELMTPTQTALLWIETGTKKILKSLNKNKKKEKGRVNAEDRLTLTLDALYKNIKPGDYLVMEKEDACRWFEIYDVLTVLEPAKTGNTITINSVSYTITGIKTQVTRVILNISGSDEKRFGSPSAEWIARDAKKIVVHYQFQHAGQIVGEPKSTILPDDPLICSGPMEKPAENFIPDNFLLQDHNSTIIKTGGTIDYATKKFTYPGTSWQHELALPVSVYGNIVRASRGQTVEREILGSGDASASNQAFKLQKKPLTYFLSPTFENDLGVENTLTVYINGIAWKEVRGFYGKTPGDQVYIVRQDDDEASWVIFGDGARGARLPSGTDNVIACYRYGAGTPAPPAGSITQVAKPVAGLKNILNPQAASGGADAENRADIQHHAPGSILVLGRAVSIRDMEAVARSVPGVRNATAEWRWQKTNQRAMVHVTYIGEKGIGENISKHLANVSDPAITIDVTHATGIKTDLSVQIGRDLRYRKDTIKAEVYDKLFKPGQGLLVPEKLPLESPLFRSSIFKAIHEVPGVTSVQDITWNGIPFNQQAKSAHPGEYFDFESGIVNISISD